MRKLTLRVTDAGCFEVTSRRPNNYGYVLVTIHGRQTLAHRHVWEECFGPIPQGMYVCHRCDNPPCVNPEHLFLGTVTDNNRDKIVKGRAPVFQHPRGEQHGRAKLTARSVQEIRHRYERGLGCALAREFHVTHSTIHRIANGKIWRHV